MASPPLLVQPFDVCHQQGLPSIRRTAAPEPSRPLWPQLFNGSRANSREVPPETIQQAVRGEYDEYDNSAIRDFVPILVERAVRAELHRA